MTAFVVYPLITVALYYLFSWALVTRWLWSRYPAWLATVANCPSCSGFWYGAAVALVGQHLLGLRFLELDATPTPLVVGLCSIVWTPILARVMLEAQARLVGGGEARQEVRDAEDPQP